MDFSLVLQTLWDLALNLIGYINTLWSWLSEPITVKLFGFTLLDITPIMIIGGVGLIAVVVLWIARG